MDDGFQGEVQGVSLRIAERVRESGEIEPEPFNAKSLVDGEHFNADKIDVFNSASWLVWAAE